MPKRSLTKVATSAKSSFKATKPLLPRLPNNMSGLTTSFSEESQGSFSTSSLRSVSWLIYTNVNVFLRKKWFHDGETNALFFFFLNGIFFFLYLNGSDREFFTGKPFEMFLHQSLWVVLSDLLACHFFRSINIGNEMSVKSHRSSSQWNTHTQDHSFQLIDHSRRSNRLRLQGNVKNTIIDHNGTRERERDGNNTNYSTR